MRLRNIKGAGNEIKNHPIVVEDPYKYKGNWNNYFNNENPIQVEFGMGKGQFIINMANRYKDINFIGFEKYTKVLVRATRRLEEWPSNLLLVRMDVKGILDVFESNEVDRIYLNFSDPWPKDRHERRRLTHGNFLELYKNILNPSGQLHFKTDNDKLFDFSIEQISNNGWDLKNVIRDLHNSIYGEGNVMTEYEEKFVELGQPIFKLEAIRP